MQFRTLQGQRINSRAIFSQQSTHKKNSLIHCFATQCMFYSDFYWRMCDSAACSYGNGWLCICSPRLLPCSLLTTSIQTYIWFSLIIGKRMTRIMSFPAASIQLNHMLSLNQVKNKKRHAQSQRKSTCDHVYLSFSPWLQVNKNHEFSRIVYFTCTSVQAELNMEGSSKGPSSRRASVKEVSQKEVSIKKDKVRTSFCLHQFSSALNGCIAMSILA